MILSQDVICKVNKVIEHKGLNIYYTQNKSNMEHNEGERAHRW